VPPERESDGRVKAPLRVEELESGPKDHTSIAGSLDDSLGSRHSRLSGWTHANSR
jgi:hypothetical protein